MSGKSRHPKIFERDARKAPRFILPAFCLLSASSDKKKGRRTLR